MTRTLAIDLDVPAALWLTANGREHWREKARRTKALRTLAYAHCTPRTTRFDGPVDVTAIISYPTARRADPANASPTVKAVLDGIVDAGLLADDDHRHVPRVTFERGPDTRRRGIYHVAIRLTAVTP